MTSSVVPRGTPVYQQYMKESENFNPHRSTKRNYFILVYTIRNEGLDCKILVIHDTTSESRRPCCLLVIVTSTTDDNRTQGLTDFTRLGDTCSLFGINKIVTPQSQETIGVVLFG